MNKSDKKVGKLTTPPPQKKEEKDDLKSKQKRK